MQRILMTAALAIAVQTSPAQTSPQAQHLTSPLVPLHSRIDSIDGQYGLWAAGDHYKAEFTQHMRFVPYLGSSHARTEEFSWRTTDVAFGELQVAIETTAPTTPTEQRVEYDLGALIEAYDIRAEGLEQTFVIANLPAPGDLVIRGQITSSLVQTTRTHLGSATPGELHFYDDQGRATVSYGNATAIDAAGHRRSMVTSFADNVVALTLDAEWLANATLPIIVDPLIRNLAVATDEVVATDIVFDPDGASDKSIWIAYERAASAIDSDIVWLRTSDHAVTTTLAYADLSTNWSTTQPACAFVGHVGSAIMVFTHIDAAGSRSVRWVVRGRTTSHNSLPEAAIAAPSGANDWRPDVGGANDGSPDRTALIVFQRELNAGPFSNSDTSLVVGQWIDVGSNSPSHAAWDQVILGGGGFDNERPSINQTGAGAPDHAWLIAWQEHLAWPNPLTATWSVKLRKASRYGLLTPTTAIPGSPTRHDLAPQVAGADGRYLVAFIAADPAAVGLKPSEANGNQLAAHRVEWPSVAPWPSYPHGTRFEMTRVAAELELEGLSFDAVSRSHWMAAIKLGAAQDHSVIRLGHTGALITQDPLATYAPGQSPARAAMTTGSTAGGHLATTGATATGFLQLSHVLPTPAAPQQVSGSSCSPAGVGWLGSQQIGSEFSRIVVAGAEPDALHLMLIATAPQNVSLAGVTPFLPGCSLLVETTGNGFLGSLPLAVGAVAEWPLPLIESLPNMLLLCQGVHTVGGITGLATTARLQVPMVR